jgi:hypothetical protein
VPNIPPRESEEGYLSYCMFGLSSLSLQQAKHKSVWVAQRNTKIKKKEGQEGKDSSKEKEQKGRGKRWTAGVWQHLTILVNSRSMLMCASVYGRGFDSGFRSGKRSRPKRKTTSRVRCFVSRGSERDTDILAI